MCCARRTIVRVKPLQTRLPDDVFTEEEKEELIDLLSEISGEPVSVLFY